MTDLSAFVQRALQVEREHPVDRMNGWGRCQCGHVHMRDTQPVIHLDDAVWEAQRAHHYEQLALAWQDMQQPGVPVADLRVALTEHKADWKNGGVVVSAFNRVRALLDEEGQR